MGTKDKFMPLKAFQLQNSFLLLLQWIWGGN